MLKLLQWWSRFLTTPAYVFQTFSVLEVLASSKMNQIEANVRDHVHGKSSVSPLHHRMQFQVIDLGVVTSGGTVNWDLASGHHAILTASCGAGGVFTIAAPTNPLSGMFLSLRLAHTTSGGNTPSWNAFWSFPGSAAPVVSTSSGDHDLFQFESFNSTKAMGSHLKGYKP